jgi:hypothetical protein
MSATGVDAARVQELVARVPEYDGYATVDELLAGLRALAESHPELAHVRRIGTSRLGEPLWCLTIGAGERDAVVVGFPHPNEPIGGLTALHLATTLCEDDALRDALGCTWHVVACVDPDGTRLNEGWFKGELTRERYARHFYRPAPDEQVEWTFPLAYKDAYFDRVLPETLALMRLIDETRPALMASLHNSEVGGVYYYLSRPLPGVYDGLAALPARLGLPLELGEPEMPHIPVLAPAIYQSMPIGTLYEFLAAMGVDPVEHITGGSSAEYAERHGTFTLVCEVPYWTDERAHDERPTDRTYADILRDQANLTGEFADTVLGAIAAVAGDLRADSPFLRATRSLTAHVADSAEETRRRAAAPAATRPATVAEVYSTQAFVHMQRLREGGMLLRALDGELAIGNATRAIRDTRAAFAARFEAWLAEDAAHAAVEPIAIRKVVAAQYGAILATAAAL